MNHLHRQSSRLAVWVLALGMLAFLAHGVGQIRAQAQPADGQNAAQEDGAAATADAEPESLGGMILDGGGLSVLFYLLLGVFSIVATTVTFERLINLKREKIMPAGFVQQLRDLLGGKEDSADNLLLLSESFPSPIGNILRAGVLRAGRPLPEVEKSMEDAAAREMAAMQSRNRPLSVVGSVAPLVGLLGTVVGMIFAFQVSSQQGLGKAESLARGIYLALITTAAGLAIAIPCLLLVAWFGSRVERYMREIDVCLLETMPSFTRMEQHLPVVQRVEPVTEPEMAGADR